MLRDLRECEVYILDYSGEVEVSNCSSCKLFFGEPGLCQGSLHSASATTRLVRRAHLQHVIASCETICPAALQLSL